MQQSTDAGGVWHGRVGAEIEMLLAVGLHAGKGASKITVIPLCRSRAALCAAGEHYTALKLSTLRYLTTFATI